MIESSYIYTMQNFPNERTIDSYNMNCSQSSLKTLVVVFVSVRTLPVLFLYFLSVLVFRMFPGINLWAVLCHPQPITGWDNIKP